MRCRRWRASWASTLAFRTGVNTGEVVVGDGQTLVTGDAVNVAARLEQAAAPGEILLGDATLRLVRDAVEVEPVEPLALQGQGRPGRRASAAPRRRRRAAGVARHLDTPLVGRDAGAAAAARRLRATRVASGRCQLFTLLGAGRASASRGWCAELRWRRRRDATIVARPLPALRRGHHLLAAGRDADPARRARGGARRGPRGGAARPSELFWRRAPMFEAVAARAAARRRPR